MQDQIHNDILSFFSIVEKYTLKKQLYSSVRKGEKTFLKSILKFAKLNGVIR